MRERSLCGECERVQRAAVVREDKRLEGERKGSSAAQRERRPVQRAAAAAPRRAIRRTQRGSQVSLDVLRAKASATRQYMS